MILSLDLSFFEELRAQKKITESEYALFLKEYQIEGKTVEDILARHELTYEEEVMAYFSEKSGWPYLDLKKIEFSKEDLHSISAFLPYHYGFIPFQLSKNELSIAISYPWDLEAMDEIQTLMDKKIRPFLSGKKEIKEALKSFYGIGAETVEQMKTQTEDFPLNGESQNIPIENLEEEASMIKFVNQVIFEAIKERSTDIHIEPYEKELIIRYRIDGVLYEAPFPTSLKEFHHSILSRIKIMANLNISEKRLPQDGRFKIHLNGISYDLRVSILPTPWGEAASIRILSGSGAFMDLKDLGFEEEDLEQIQNALKIPHGIILVTGPTGSGKTTTLYAFLKRLNSRDRKIVTIEDPIEYLIPGITQVQIHTKIHFTFATALRSMLRHDPDVMMIGEIRDFETAEISVQAALTGHLVFSTLHTNDAASSITRLIDIGVEHFLVASALQCAIAQRLVRVLCPLCKREKELTEEVRKTLPHLPPHLTHVYEPKGCKQCHFTGYFGRMGIYEIIWINAEIRELIQTKVSSAQIKEAALNQGMISIRENGYKKVSAGITSLDEVIRVTEDCDHVFF